MFKLRQSTERIVIVGPALRFVEGNPPYPILSLPLSSCYYKKLVKANGQTVDLYAHTWNPITMTGGLHKLTLTSSDTDTLGSLTLIIYDTAIPMAKPIFHQFDVVAQNVFDSNYGDKLLRIEQPAQ